MTATSRRGYASFSGDSPWPTLALWLGFALWQVAGCQRPDTTSTDRTDKAPIAAEEQPVRKPPITSGEGPTTAEVAIPASPLVARDAGDAPAVARSDRARTTVPVSPPEFASPISRKLERRDARSDSWDTEVVSESIAMQLQKIATLLKAPDPSSRQSVAEIADAEFECSLLRPSDLELAFAGETLTAYRGSSTPAVHQRAAGLLTAVEELGIPLQPATDVHVKFKVARIDMQEGQATTTVHFAADVHSSAEAFQQNATWQCIWSLTSGEAPPLLRSIRLEDYTESRTNGNEGTLFADCTAAVLGENPAWREQLLPSTEHWLARTTAQVGTERIGLRGLAIGDVNADGLDDLYVCEPGGLPNKLFLQQSDGTARDVSQAAAVDLLDASRSALLIDLDNDGDQDLVVATRDNVIVMANDGTPRFAIKATIPTTAVHSLAAADFDSDRDLDIYACRYYTADQSEFTPIPYYDANNGPRNLLLRNESEWEFRDAAQPSGLNENNQRYSYAAAWEDFDNDGDLDLYVANDFGRNNLYRNTDGHFEDVAAAAAVEDISAGMGVTWGDYNNDGQMDLYVSNMFSTAGGRVTYQRRFQPDIEGSAKALYQRHARGNTLFENVGDGQFRDVSLEAGVTRGRWAWGAKFVDINNDSREDLVVTNGFVTNEDTRDL